MAALDADEPHPGAQMLMASVPGGMRADSPTPAAALGPMVGPAVLDQSAGGGGATGVRDLPALPRITPGT